MPAVTDSPSPQWSTKGQAMEQSAFSQGKECIFIYDVELPMHSQCYRMGSEGADQSPDVMIHHGGNISE